MSSKGKSVYVHVRYAVGVEPTLALPGDGVVVLTGVDDTYKPAANASATIRVTDPAVAWRLSQVWADVAKKMEMLEETTGRQPSIFAKPPR